MLTFFWLINENCSNMNDFIATTSFRSSCSSEWRFKILSVVGVARRVSCVYWKKGSGLSDGSSIALVSFVVRANLSYNYQKYSARTILPRQMKVIRYVMGDDTEAATITVNLINWVFAKVSKEDNKSFSITKISFQAHQSLN